ncbi:MAG: choice-of-anchor D domain-containing protein, partial [Pseudomonadota bacterium]
TFPIPMPDGAQTVITIKFSPTTKGIFEGQILINTNVGISRTVNLSAQATSPVLKVAPTALDFGTANVGTTTDLPLTIYNDGDDTLNITSCGTFPTGFSLVGACPTSISGGGSQTLTIRFSPIDVLSYSGSINIQTNAGDQAVSLSGQGAGGKISLSQELIDFGTVPTGLPKTVALTVTNTGNAPMSITGITNPASPFSVVSVGTPPIQLLPGTSYSIIVIFNPTAANNYSSSFVIQTNAINGNKTVNLQGFGVSPFMTIQEGDGTSDGTLEFGSVKIGQEKPLTLTITNNGTISYNITSISGVISPFSMTMPSLPYTLDSGESLELTIMFTPTQSGGFTGQINIQTNITGLSQIVNLSGTGTTPVLSVSPTTLDFGSVTAGTSSDLTVTLSNTGNETLTVNTLSVTGTGFSLVGAATPINIAPGNSQNITVRFSPTDVKNYSGSLSIQSNGGNQTVSLSGQGAGGRATLSPEQIDFGAVAAGSSETVALIVTNTGNAAMNITGITAPSSPFSVSFVGTPPIQLFPETQVTILVTFSPTTANNYSSSFVVQTDAINGNRTVNLQGVGVAPDISITP